MLFRAYTARGRYHGCAFVCSASRKWFVLERKTVSKDLGFDCCSKVLQGVMTLWKKIKDDERLLVKMKVR